MSNIDPFEISNEGVKAMKYAINVAHLDADEAVEQAIAFLGEYHFKETFNNVLEDPGKFADGNLDFDENDDNIWKCQIYYCLMSLAVGIQTKSGYDILDMDGFVRQFLKDWVNGIA